MRGSDRAVCGPIPTQRFAHIPIRRCLLQRLFEHRPAHATLRVRCNWLWVFAFRAALSFDASFALNVLIAYTCFDVLA